MGKHDAIFCLSPISRVAIQQQEILPFSSIVTISAGSTFGGFTIGDLPLACLCLRS